MAGSGISVDTLKRLNLLLPDAEPRLPLIVDDPGRIIPIETSDGIHYMYENVVGHYFEAIQEKLLFGHIFDETTQELMFFERSHQLPEFEKTIVKAWLPNTLLNVRKYVGTGLKFFDGLDEFYIDSNNSVCHYNRHRHSVCPAEIRTLLFEKEWLFRYIGVQGEPFHSHSSKPVPIQNVIMSYKEAISAINRKKPARARGVGGAFQAPDLVFASAPIYKKNKKNATLLTEPGTSNTYYHAKQVKTKNGFRWKCSFNRNGCRAYAYVKASNDGSSKDEIEEVAFGGTHTGHKSGAD